MTTLKTLKDHQDLILLAEIGALIHDLGKLGKEFIIKQSSECYKNNKAFPECGFDHEQILKASPGFVDSTLVKLLTDQAWRPRLRVDSITQLRQTPEHLGHYLSGHSVRLDSGVGLLALITRCDQVDSGVDKGALQNSAKQRWDATFGATAFGYEARPLSVGSGEDGLKVLRDELTKALTEALSQVLDSKASPAQVRSRVLVSVESAFRRALGETRRGANDVTLWDHACSVASLHKAALAQILLEKQWPSNLRQLRWRVLRIAFDGFQFLERAHHIPDLLGRLQAIQEALDGVRMLLEVTLPLGNEIYRDENGSAFIVPDIQDLLEYTDEQGNMLRDRIGKAFGVELHGEIQLDLSLEWLSKPSRYGIELGRLLSNSLPPLAADPKRVGHQWDAQSGAEICTVCGLRPQGPSTKAKDRNVCDICEQRRGDRSKAWSKKLATTIWTDEVADTNGRLALIVAHFDLTAWLDGRLLSSVLAQWPLTDIAYEEAVAQLAEELRKNVKPDCSNQLLLQRLAPEAFHQPAQDFYQAVVEERDIHDLAQAVAADDYYRRAELLLLFLLRKNPSFARIRRIWETTRSFWQEVLPTDQDSDLTQSLVGQVLGLAGPRLEIRGTLHPQRSGDTLGPYHTYELVLLRGVKLSGVWDSDRQRFITCDNLDYLSGDRQLGRPVQEVLRNGAVLTVEEPVGYGATNKVWGTIHLTQDATPIQDSQYTPAIPILAEPRTFMALIPADKALKVIQAIKAKYDQEMARVRNRLPLHLGVVFDQRRTPLATMLEAGRRMLERKQRNEQGVQEGNLWQIIAKPEKQSGSLPESVASLANGTQQFKEWYAVHLQQYDRQFTWYVPAVMGDGATEDVWYPYVLMGDATKTNGRQRAFRGVCPTPKGVKECWLVHVGDLEENDKIYFAPATFDFEFLDTTARRFEIAYDDRGQRRSPSKRNRPYLLDDLGRLGELWKELCHLEKSQRHQVIATIEATREAWFGDDREGQSLADQVFRQFVHDTLAGANWPKDYRWKTIPDWRREDLVVASVRGELADLAELYQQILKE